MNIYEFVKDVKVLDGEFTAQIPLTPDRGQIVSAVFFYKNANNPGLIRCTLRTDGGKDLISLQPIDNLRSRDINYMQSGKPVDFEGGNKLIFQIVATEAFTGDFVGDLLLIYAPTVKEAYCPTS